MNILEIKKLHVAYGAIQAINDVSISVEDKKIVAILGSNGAGKTTLLRTISGLVESQAGEVVYLGENIVKNSAEKITFKGISHAPEGRQIFTDLSVIENLKIGGFTVKSGKVKITDIYESAKNDRIKKLIAKTETTNETMVLSKQEMLVNNLARVYKYFPVLKERKDQMANTLSGGEQQMLAIGRALMGSPKLLILDEPSLGLAPLIVKSIFSIITELNKEGLSVLIVEQNALQTLKIADYAYVLQVGKVVKEGTGKQLINDDELIEAYLGK